MPTRLPDPFTHPGLAPGFTSAPLVDNEPILQDALPNGKVLEVSSALQYWSTTITYPDLFDEEYRLISSAINAAKAGDGQIQLALPQYLHMRVFGDLSTISIAAGQTGSSIVLGNTAGITGRPYVGDLFQLSTHNKVYKITSVSVDSVNNTMTLGLYPKLAIATTASMKPKFNDILFNMKLTNRSTITETLNSDGMYESISYSLREHL